MNKLNIKNKDRYAGILMPIFSLPSKYGIGTLGKEAYKFVKFLKASKQTYWQVLPIGPTSYGDSPYQSFSSFAGNPYFIDLDLLIEDGLLNKKDVRNLKNSVKIDYGYIYKTRIDILRIAFNNGYKKYKKQFEVFLNLNKKWLPDYALFISLKKHFDMKSWQDWDTDIKNRDPKAIKYYKKLLKDEIVFNEFIQFLFFKQYTDLKSYANKNGIKIIGDVPIYVALDSCDVWVNTDEFKLNKKTLVPKQIAGVPPDYFQADGQLWGNPLYDWQNMKKDNYKWWKNRIEGIAKNFDVIRFDHFRGFEEYYSIKYGSKNAKNGKWLKGPGINFINQIKNEFSNIEFIVEDLGIIDDKVRKLVEKSNFPGMRVIEFSIDLTKKNCHLPHNYIENCVCYTTTHDNVPLNGWIKSLNKKYKNYLINYYNLKKDYTYGLIRAGMNSVAYLFICQIQDYLVLDEKATVNKPGTIGNWTWRLKPGQLNKDLAKKIATMTKAANRGLLEFM